MTDFRDQLKNLFPDHPDPNECNATDDGGNKDFTPNHQNSPLICRYEKRKGKGTTIIEGFEGDHIQLKYLAKILKRQLSVGGGIKDHSIILQSNARDKIMKFLNNQGYTTKRVGG